MCRVIAEVMTAPNRVPSKPEDVFASLDDQDIEQGAMSDAAGAEPSAVLANPAEPPVPQQRIQSMLRKLHVNTGHSSIQQMLRLANRCQVSEEANKKSRSSNATSAMSTRFHLTSSVCCPTCRAAEPHRWH